MLSQRRAALAGKSGAAGLVQNARTTFIAIFASMGGLVYGYNQGMFGQVLSMRSFSNAAGTNGISNPTLAGLLTAILELGAWIGVLANGYSADRLGRKLSVVVACFIFTVGVIVQACTHGGNYDYILAGRFVTGLGVGSLSMIVPLYNAEIAPAETRGALVALQQLAITFGIMVSYWLTYGTNFIGGAGDSQSRAAWLIPMCIQILPALILAGGILFMPQSPRWLMDQGRDAESLAVIANLRRQAPESDLVQLEYLELKAQKLFEDRMSRHYFPNIQDDSAGSRFKLGLAQYKSLFSNRSNMRRTMVAVLVMLFQQWTGVNFILYYAPFIFQSIGLTGSSISLLASGVVGVAMFLATIPAVLYLDTWGRKPVLISGAIIMGICHFVVAGIIGQFNDQWGNNPSSSATAAGWVACVFIWLFAVAFGYSWGPTAWVIVSEVFPLSMRAKGVSLGASSNWLNNFAVAMSTPDFVAAAPFGAYIFLGMMCVIGAAWVFWFVPETKGRTLDELDEVFADKSGQSVWEAEQMIQAQRDVGLLDLADIEHTNSNNSAHGEKTKAETYHK